MPRVKLTATNVGTLKAGPVRTDYRDAYMPGLVLRVSATGARVWVVEYHVDFAGQRLGRRHRLGTFPVLGLKDAREAARLVLLAIGRGEVPARRGAPKSPLTVGELVKRCLAELDLRPATRREWERLHGARIVKAPIGDRPAAEVERGEVREWVKAIRATSPATARNALALLRRSYSWAIGEELLGHSPCAGVEAPAVESRERILSAAELFGLLRALRRRPGVLADATRALLLTGVRVAAVLGARGAELEDLGGPNPRWIVPGGAAGRSKNLRPHVVPLSPQAAALMKARLDVAGEVLFPGYWHGAKIPALPSQWLAWLRARVARTVAALDRRAGVETAPDTSSRPWVLHSLRHTIATHLRESFGIRRDVVELILSHTNRGAAATRVYDRAELLPERRAALTAWAAWLERLGKDKGADVVPFMKKGGR